MIPRKPAKSITVVCEDGTPFTSESFVLMAADPEGFAATVRLDLPPEKAIVAASVLIGISQSILHAANGKLGGASYVPPRQIVQGAVFPGEGPDNADLGVRANKK